MQNAAKEKTFLFSLIAPVLLFCAPAIASSIDVSALENRVELFSLGGENRVGESRDILRYLLFHKR